MPIQETLEFRSNDFCQVAAKASTEWLRQQEVIATRKVVLSNSFGVSVGVSDAVTTGGVSVLFAAYKTRSAYVAGRKLEIIQAELQKRNVELHKFSKSKDLLGPIAIGAIGVVIGTEVSDLIDGITNIEQLGAGLPDVDSITNDTSSAAAIATTDAVAYYAGMIQIETVAQEIGHTAAEKFLFALGEASPECRHSVGGPKLSCNNCKAKITRGTYRHCCDCHDDNYNICQKCYDNNVRCTQTKHAMKMLQTPTTPDLFDKISATPGYDLLKPRPGSSISRSELTKKYLFRCNFCEAEVRQGKLLLPIAQRTSVIVWRVGTRFLVSAQAVKGQRIKGPSTTAAFAKTCLDPTTTPSVTPATLADFVAKTQVSMFCFAISISNASNTVATALGARVTSVQVLSFTVASAPETA
ncbi:hypothetical protein F5Y07DRAFT_408102 [Xylaria sp. FL0933]|nr:hypothetical protein F5Y07DRAFT_408102 [Xylaria sp. FL0933]